MSKRLDLAILYLRIAVGGMLLLHNIGNLQRYNTLIDGYPSWQGITGGVIFGLIMLIESLSALMLIIGWRVRLAAVLLTAQSIFSLLIYHPLPSSFELELRSLYTFIYIYIFIAGGGLYSYDGFRTKNPCEE